MGKISAKYSEHLLIDDLTPQELVGGQDTSAEFSVNAVTSCLIRRAAFLIYFLVVTLQLTILAVLSKNFFLGLLDAYFLELEQYFITKCFNQTILETRLF